MAHKYKRKPGGVPRNISWTESSLALAFKELDKKQKGIDEISRMYGISSRNLRRRYDKKDQQLLTQGKKSNRDTEKILKVKNANYKIENTNKKVPVDDYCAECFENYNFTKSKSDWIQCKMCQMWLHETCTTFKNHCMRCGKLKTLVASGHN